MMRNSEWIFLFGLSILSLSSVTLCRSLPSWSTGTEVQSESDPDLSPKDTGYWPNVIPSNWILPLGPRENRAENFIRFGRSNVDKNQANKKNNFIRLGRENPRQNNFIRLGRGQEDGWKFTDIFRESQAPDYNPNTA